MRVFCKFWLHILHFIPTLHTTIIDIYLHLERMRSRSFIVIFNLIHIFFRNQLTLADEIKDQKLLQRPVIGILSQPHDDEENTYYIAASYVKWLESGGAQSIAIPYDADETLIREIFSQINGVLFPGGSAQLPSSARTLWQLILENNQRGHYFPVWGTCLGFEFLVMLTAQSDEVMLQTSFNAENISMPLIFPDEDDVKRSNGTYSTTSELYPYDFMKDVLENNNITMNNHVRGIDPDHFLSNTNLTDMFHITSTNFDRDGNPFVSSIEGKKFPFYGVQYHPEKNNFEYGLVPGTLIPYEAIDHSSDAIYTSMFLAAFFVNRVRHSSIGKYTMIERHPLIQDYPVRKGYKFEQIYLIPSARYWRKSNTYLRGGPSVWKDKDVSTHY